MPMLSEIAFRHYRLMLAAVVGLMLFGVFSYFNLPAQEDPKITVREAVVTSSYPGMSANKIELLITKTIEEAIRSLPSVDQITSVSTPGKSVIHVKALQTVTSHELTQVWDQLRKKLDSVKLRLPEGTGPVFLNEDFGDVAVLTVALLADDGYSMGEQQDMAQHISDSLFRVKGVKRIELLGVQEERIYIETSNAKLAQLNVAPSQLIAELRNQNIISPGGVVDAKGKNFTVTPSGNFDSVAAIRSTLISLPGRQQSIVLGDIATVRRGLVDPPSQTAYYNGEQTIVFAISQQNNVNLLEFTPEVERAIERLNASMPVGYRLESITRQADVVEQAVYGVTENVIETLIIVLCVVVLFLGVRTGLIVGSIVPVVILITLACMNYFDMALERMSLATLIISLGLLVDNSIVVAEDMKQRLELGESRDEALRNTGKSLALPLLSSSATTILVFLPLMLANSDSGEYTRSVSLIIFIALSISWVLCLTLTPFLCHRFIKIYEPGEQSGFSLRVSAFFDSVNRNYERALRGIMRARAVFLLVMLLAFFTSVWGLSFVPVQFFPSSDRSQVLVYIDMPAGTSMRATDQKLQEIFTVLEDKERFPHIKKYAAYGGFGGPRFVLSLTPIDPEDSKAFIMFDVGDREHSEPTIKALRAMFEQEFPDIFASVTKMFLGPSDSSLIEVQVSGPDQNFIYDIALDIERLFDDIEGVYEVKNDWENRVTELKVNVDQHNARRAGVSSFDIAQSLQTYYSGRVVSEFREGDDIFPIVLRANDAERFDLNRITDMSIYANARNINVPLAQIAEVSYETSFARVVREDMFRTVTVAAKNHLMSAEDMVPFLEVGLAEIRQKLPPGYSIQYSGVIKDSGDSQASLNENLPLCVALIFLVLIAQFRSYRRTAIIVATIPLIIIGAAVGLLVMQAPFGFMVILGLYALAGIIVNNAIVLIDRIDIEREELLIIPGENVSKANIGDKEVFTEHQQANASGNYEAVISASVRRLRPIVMSVATTILGLLPLMLSQDALFYGLATVIAFGLAISTVFTLGFVPVMYTYFFRIKPLSQ